MEEDKLEELKAERNKLNEIINSIERQKALDRKQNVIEQLSPDDQKLMQVKLVELERMKQVYVKAKEDGKLRREHERKRYGQATIDQARAEAERRRKESLTPIQQIEDEIITYRQMIDMEKGCYTNYKRPGEQTTVMW